VISAVHVGVAVIVAVEPHFYVTNSGDMDITDFAHSEQVLSPNARTARFSSVLINRW